MFTTCTWDFRWPVRCCASSPLAIQAGSAVGEAVGTVGQTMPARSSVCVCVLSIIDYSM